MLPVARLRLTILLLAAGAARAFAQAEEPPRYWALLRDGTQVTGSSLQNGNWWDDKVTLGGRRLFDAGNPVRVLCDRKLASSAAACYVLLANGDVLPGRVRQFLPASADGDVPGRLLVSLEPPLCTRNPAGLAIRADRVLRIVTVRTGTAAREPGTLIFTDGRTITATAIRWADQGAKALAEAGIVSAPFEEIADLSVPKVDVMAALSDDRFYPPLDPRSLIARLETTDGAALTYCRELSRVALFPPDRKFIKIRSPRKGIAEPLDYLHVQPSWALDPILVPVETICRQGFRSRNEVPLSVLPAQLLKQQAALHAWPWCRNRSVRGEVLESGRITADLGVGTHSYSEIAFDLPPQAKEFTTLVGLDRSVDGGACVVCKIFPNQVAGKPLFNSGFLRGATEPIPVGPLDVEGAKRLVLVTEFGDEGRPQAAYPLDIGDHVDWLMPFVTLDENAGKRLESLQRFVPGWQNWNLDPVEAAEVNVAPYWDDARERWLPVVRLVDGKQLTLKRALSSVTHANDIVELRLAHGEESPPAIELRVNGTPLEPVVHEQAVANRVAPGPRKEESGKGTGAGDDPPRDKNAGDIAAKDQLAQYKDLTVRWNVQSYRGRAVQLVLNVPFDRHRRGLVWHECIVKSAIADLPPGGHPARNQDAHSGDRERGSPSGL